MDTNKLASDNCSFQKEADPSGFRDKHTSATSHNEEDKGRSAPTATPKAFSKRNWDKIVQEFEEEEEKEQSIDDLFKQIYSTGSEDTRRAMNKSFQESGGTVLSTNWRDVASKKVEPKPPSDNDT